MKNREIYFICALTLGVVVGFSQLMAPFHEFAHIAQAGKDGSDASITGWAVSQIQFPTARSILAGWIATFTWSLMFAVGFSIVGRKAKKLPWITGGAAIGYAGATWIRAFTSSDFNSTMKAYVASKLQDANLLPQVWDQIHNALSLRWGLIGGFFLSGALIWCIISVEKPITPKK